MSDAEVFHATPGLVSVRKLDGGVEKLKVPLAWTEARFRNALSATYSAYLAYGRIPTPAEVHEFWTRISEAAYSELFVTDEFRDAMAHRGVYLGGSAGLSYEQSLAIDKLSNPLDKRSNEVKLKELGVSPVKLAAWRKEPLFAKVYAQRSENNLAEHIPDIINRMVGKAEAGNIQAADRILAMSGRWDPAAREAVVLKEFLVEFYRIVAVEIPDLEQRQRIAQQMTLAAGNIAMIESTQKGAS